MDMNWLKTNAVSITIALLGVATTYSVLGYRVDQAERNIEANKASISILASQQNNMAVQFAAISENIKSIKETLDRLFPYARSGQ